VKFVRDDGLREVTMKEWALSVGRRHFPACELLGVDLAVFVMLTERRVRQAGISGKRPLDFQPKLDQ
jgi:hypothetical protein